MTRQILRCREHGLIMPHFGCNSVPFRFYVDGVKHRLVKVGRTSMWAGYCPERGPDDIVYSTDWPMMLVLTRTACPHIDALRRPILTGHQHHHQDRSPCLVSDCPWSVCAHLASGDHDCADPTREATCYYGQDR